MAQTTLPHYMVKCTDPCCKCSQRRGKPAERRVGPLPLSQTKLPFGHCWLHPLDALCRKYPHRIERVGKSSRYVFDMAGERVYFVLMGLTFDEVPLSYLDWLVGQDWLYGDLKKRLCLYMTHPTAQQLLAEKFGLRTTWLLDDRLNRVGLIDEEDDARDPAFTTQTYDKWHGITMPAEEPDEYVPRMTKTRAWGLAAELLARWEDTEPEDALAEDVIDMQEVRAACDLLPPLVVSRLRNALKAYEARLEHRARLNLVQLELVEYFATDVYFAKLRRRRERWESRKQRELRRWRKRCSSS